MSANNNVTQRMKAVLYALKKEYGGPISIYKKGTSQTNPATGEKTVLRTALPIRRAAILPGNISRNEIRGISLISANKQLVQGGQYDIESRTFIVDGLDAPSLELTEDDWVVCDGMKFQVQRFEEFPSGTAWVIGTKAVLGEKPEQIIFARADNLLDLSSSASVQ